MSNSSFATQLPLVRAPLALLQAHPLREMVRLQRKYGEVACWADGDERIWFAFGPRQNHAILTDTERFHSCFCPIRGPRGSAQRRLTSGLLSMNGETHRRHRRLLSPPFSRAAMGGYLPGIRSRIDELLGRWSVGQTRDIRGDMDQLLLEITSGMLFGVDEPELATRVGTSIERFLAKNHEVGLAAVSSQATGHSNYDELLVTAEEVEREIREVIALRRRRANRGGDLVSLMLQARDEEGAFNDDDLLGHAALLFGAAKSTTAHTLTWTLILGSLHPEAVERVREELTQRPRGDADEERLERLPRLVEFIEESMRILPASAYVQRVTSRPVELGPFQLPRGATVVFSQFVSHRMAEYFPEPDRFLPGRWRESKPEPYSYIPFGMGPRLCIGSTLALTTMHLFLGECWRRFTLQLLDEATIDAEVVATMLAPRSAVPMRLLPASHPSRPTRISGTLAEWLPDFA